MTLRLLTLAFGAAWLVFAAVLAPARLWLSWGDLGQLGINVSEARGTIWRGQFTRVFWRGYPLGEVSYDLSPATLLLARAKLHVDVAGERGTARGTVAVGVLGRWTITDTSLDLDLAGLPTLFNVSGQIEARAMRADFTRSGCNTAAGQLSTNALVNGLSGLSWTGPMLRGAVRCDDGALVLALDGADENQSVTMAIAIAPDKTYQTEVNVRSENAELKSWLDVLGFRDGAQGATLVQDGRWGE